MNGFELIMEYSYPNKMRNMDFIIMNEVFNVANDIDCPIYYTDTDSLHCKFDDVIKIENKYRDVYDKELNGKNLEQFHTDFDLDGACSEIYATKSIFLGKIPRA